MPTVWDRLDRLRSASGPKERGTSGAPSPPKLDIKKLDAWQKRKSSQPPAYSFSGAPGPKPARPPRDFDDAGGEDVGMRGSPKKAKPKPPAVQAAPRPPPQPPVSLRNHRAHTYARPASSIYSQPSPMTAKFAAAEKVRTEAMRYMDVDPAAVSPPSSPDEPKAPNGYMTHNDGDVSPIEASPPRPARASRIAMEPLSYGLPARPDQSRTSTTNTTTNIPHARREQRRAKDAALNAVRDSKSREKLGDSPLDRDSPIRDPTAGAKDPSSQADSRNEGQRRPSGALASLPSQSRFSARLAALSSQATPNGRLASPPPQSNTTPAHKPGRLASLPPPRPNGAPAEPVHRKAPLPPRQTSLVPPAEPATASKPDWRGASGRTALVAPVNDTPNVPPLNIPRKSSKRTPGIRGVASPVTPSDSETTSSPPAQLSNVRGPADTTNHADPPKSNVAQKSQVNAIANSNKADHAHAYPSPPLSSDGKSAAPGPTPKQVQPPREPASPSFPPNDKAIRRKPAKGDHPRDSWSSSIHSQDSGHGHLHPAQAPTGTLPADWRTRLPSQQQPTRLSGVASRGTTTQPPVAPNNVPEPARKSVAPAANSILDRKRPVVSGYEHLPRRVPSEPIRLNMASPYYAVEAPRPLIHRKRSALSVASAASSLDKQLPKAPPEVSARDRVQQLNAQLEQLAHRRSNTNMAIKQMTELMPTDNLLASADVMRKREREKRKVENLRSELSEIQHEEYELGLKLHRAYKRIDRDAEYEPTTLWVRRVTG